jgi:hypothetical protein
MGIVALCFRGCKHQQPHAALPLAFNASAAAPGSSAGSFDRFLNLQISLVIFMQIAMALFCAIANYIWQKTEGKKHFYLALNYNVQVGLYIALYMAYCRLRLVFREIMGVVFVVPYSHLDCILLLVNVVSAANGLLAAASSCQGREKKCPHAHSHKDCKPQNAPRSGICGLPAGDLFQPCGPDLHQLPHVLDSAVLPRPHLPVCHHGDCQVLAGAPSCSWCSHTD